VATARCSQRAGQILIRSALFFLSPRTMEMHLPGCLLNLNCRTRAEASAS
jgi:hypothetical protein